jgi:hypothetical protein
MAEKKKKNKNWNSKSSNRVDDILYPDFLKGDFAAIRNNAIEKVIQIDNDDFYLIRFSLKNYEPKNPDFKMDVTAYHTLDPNYTAPAEQTSAAVFCRIEREKSSKRQREEFRKALNMHAITPNVSKSTPGMINHGDPYEWHINLKFLYNYFKMINHPRMRDEEFRKNMSTLVSKIFGECMKYLALWATKSGYTRNQVVMILEANHTTEFSETYKKEREKIFLTSGNDALERSDTLVARQNNLKLANYYSAKWGFVKMYNGGFMDVANPTPMDAGVHMCARLSNIIERTITF